MCAKDYISKLVINNGINKRKIIQLLFLEAKGNKSELSSLIKHSFEFTKDFLSSCANNLHCLAAFLFLCGGLRFGFSQALIILSLKGMACVHSTRDEEFFHSVHSTFCSFVEEAHSWGSSRTEHVRSMMFMLGETCQLRWDTYLGFWVVPRRHLSRSLDHWTSWMWASEEYLRQTIIIFIGGFSWCHHLLLSFTPRFLFRQDRACVV